MAKKVSKKPVRKLPVRSRRKTAVRFSVVLLPIGVVAVALSFALSLVWSPALIASAHTATVNGGSVTITANPGDTLHVSIVANLTEGDYVEGINWGFFPDSLQCEDVEDFDTTFIPSGPHDHPDHITTTPFEFDVPAPTEPGTYPFYFQVTGSDDCQSLQGTLLSNDNAVTVTEPEAPPAEDMCPNLDGTQASVPEGDVIVDGNCMPVAVCASGDNLPTLDAATNQCIACPEGQMLDTDANQCIEPPPAVENTEALCSDGVDNDNDEAIDLADTDCAAFVPPPTTEDTDNGGGSVVINNDGGGTIPSLIGVVTQNPGNTSGTGGLVLGTSTEASDSDLPAGCSAYLDGYLRMGGNNNPEAVKKLQTFLNAHMNAGLPVTGVFGPMTFEAVKNFQVANWEKVLKPWVAYGLPSDHTPTGYVYKTTKHAINLISCSSINEPEPQLP